ncbi:MAG: acetyl/propionyl/methylcrotonyl-CoA carboxylase subunit alpha [Acidimicrobiales bacterium]
MRILVANRGEIARRVLHTAHKLGHETVAVYAEPDKSSPHVAEATTSVNIGPAALAESYLSAERILDAAVQTSADAVHPGYGFLSENAAFADAVASSGLIWIGPHPGAVTQMGSKIEARRLAIAAGVPVIPGYDASQDPDDLERAATEIGYPILLKASGGGGGKGIRIARDPTEFVTALTEASAEAKRSFGDDAMIVERFIERPRHIEVQLVGDKQGNVIHLGTRECSVQRRYQKLLEEAPAPNLDDDVRNKLHAAAVGLADSIGYDSAGTVEFIVDADDPSNFFFLEMNTRLQVEHPTTEMVTGLDLVALQLAAAQGLALPVGQDDVAIDGHAIEARINAEDPKKGFAPQVGTITDLIVPSAARWDSGIEVGSEVSPHYDPMIAKLIVWGADREAARTSLANAIDELLVGGIVTNAGFHRWLIEQPVFSNGAITTRFLDETDVSASLPDAQPAASAAARAWWSAIDLSASPSPWRKLGGRHFTPHIRDRALILEHLDGETFEVRQSETQSADEPTVAAAAIDAARVVVNLSGQSHTFDVISRSDHWSPDAPGGHGRANVVAAPFPAVIAEVAVQPGSEVQGGDTVVVIEAMKMLHTLSATGPGTVAEVRISAGDQVASGQVLVTFDTPEPGADQ